jgi:uncharacterized zinc-type alcohol dehydrogenase-like protein
MATTAEPSPATISEATSGPTKAKGWGTDAPDQPLRPMEFQRRALRPDDVAIQITYAGICHSDLHTARNDWGGTVYPNIPGHEIVGKVTAVGDNVSRHQVGDTVAVGCMVDSCMACDQCLAGWEVFCREGCTQTYNSPDRHTGEITKGGYTDHVVVRDHFVLKVPQGMDESRVAPLLCAGITTYSPLNQYDVGPETDMAVVGLGGLGHMGVKFGAALGARVTMITTTPAKGEDARKLGAHDVIVSTDEQQMRDAATRFDFILNTVPVSHEIDGYLRLLGRSGRMVIVGALNLMPGFVGANLIWWNRAVGGSAIGGIPETQEMLDLCGEKGIYPECEFIAMNQINEAYERLLKNDVRYRFVVDMSRGL